MLVGSNDGDLPSRKLGKVRHFVQQYTFHSSGVICGVGAIEDFHELKQ